MWQQILRLPAVLSQSGLPRSTLYLRVKQGLWTEPISLGGRSKGWPGCDVTALNGARIAGKTDDEIRVLVKKLHAIRKSTYRMAS